jgi:DNA-binding HxlR family transcriptional regulator
MIKELAADPYAADCPSRQLLDRIGDKWTVLVMISLTDGPKRYTQLARHIERVSQKMLTQTLRALERDGLITRTVHASVPPQVDYELTDLGRSLLAPITALEQWATAHMQDVIESRRSHDARVGIGA